MLVNRLYVACFLVIVICLSVATGEKYRFCVVDGRGGFKRAAKYCPLLDTNDSEVECVVGVDRLDCLRMISKGFADFSVFTAEDLVTAANSEVEVLLTNELRFKSEPYEYAVVAVVSDDSGIQTRYDLKDRKFCHPGYGYETDWTRILANYLEASVVPQLCNPGLTITENRIKASSQYFESACKSGPWVSNPYLDLELKRKYPNLCSLCDNPIRCSKDDKYGGRRGPLFCLTDGAGDVAWARLDDVKVHFGLAPGGTESTPNGYSLICPDGSKMPVNSTNPCVWVVKPWSAVASARTDAQDIQQLMMSILPNSTETWKRTLLTLIEPYTMSIVKVQPLEAIESYLDRATGFLNANSFSGCHPPRTIRICTTSILENYKCVWLRESAAAYGIEPDFDCIKADNTTHCMEAVNEDVADIVMVEPDLLHTAISQYNLQTLFYETVLDKNKYVTVPIVKKNSGIETFEELRGRGACFPMYDGIGWNSVIKAFQDQKLLNGCPSSSAMAEFFGPSCVPGVPSNISQSLKQACDKNVTHGDFGAIGCLVRGTGDVAFVSENSLKKYLDDPEINKHNTIKADDFKILCPEHPCHLSWAPVGQAMVKNNRTTFWMRDTLDVFVQVNILFGKSYRSITLPFTLFGPFDGKSNILFHDATERFRDAPIAKTIDDMPRQYEPMLKNLKFCQSNSMVVKYSFSLILHSIIIVHVFNVIYR